MSNQAASRRGNKSFLKKEGACLHLNCTSPPFSLLFASSFPFLFLILLTLCHPAFQINLFFFEIPEGPEGDVLFELTMLN